MEQMPPEKQAPSGNMRSPLDKQFIELTLDPKFGEIMQQAMDNMPSPVHAAAFLLAQTVQQVEAKLGPIKDDVIFSQSGAGTKMVMTILKMADEAGYEGAADMENVESAVKIAAAMSAAGEAMADLSGGQEQQPAEQPGLMAAAGGQA